MPEFFSALVWNERVRELKSTSQRDSNELAQLATLLARAEKRTHWLRKHHRTKHGETADTAHGLALAQCCLVAAQIREYVASWAKEHTDTGTLSSSVHELQETVTNLLGSMLAVVEQLKARHDGALDPAQAALPSAGHMEPPGEIPEDGGSPA